MTSKNLHILKVILCVVQIYGFLTNAWCYIYTIRVSKNLHCSKRLSVLHLFHPSFPPSNVLAIIDLYIISMVLPFPEYHIMEIIQPFQAAFFHLAICIWDSSSFHGLIANSFLLQNNMTLCQYTWVCLSIYLFKDILLVHSLWWLWIRSL